jgi:glutathione S-transferase
MTIEVFWGSGSPFAWRVLLTLEIKKIPYTSRLIEFSKQEHRSPEILALNPRGKVPVLRDGDYAVSESLAILAYLDRRYPEPPLFGRTAQETGRVWQRISEGVSYFEPLTDRIVRPVFFNKVAGNEADIRDALGTLHQELKRLEDTIGRQDWLAGPALSAADIALYPFVEALLRAAAKPAAMPLELGLMPFAERYPAVHAWRGRIAALPGYDRTYPPHWRAQAA